MEPKQTGFLAIPEREDDAAARRLRQVREGVGSFQHAGHAAGVVVGAVMDLTDGTVAVGGFAVADVIVMAHHDDIFFLQFRIAAFDAAEDVAAAVAEELVVSAVGAGALEIELLKLLAEIGSGGAAAAAARFATFEGIVGQDVDDVLNLIERDGSHRGRFGTGVGGQGARTELEAEQSAG